jgi:hypothetical protein
MTAEAREPREQAQASSRAAVAARLLGRCGAAAAVPCSGYRRGTRDPRSLADTGTDLRRTRFRPRGRRTTIKQEMCAFSDAELQTISKAFQRAWDRYLRTGFLTPQNLGESRELLAGRILRAAHYGEQDEWRLARDAVEYLCDIKHRGKTPPKLSPRRRNRVRPFRKPKLPTPAQQIRPAAEADPAQFASGISGATCP